MLTDVAALVLISNIAAAVPPQDCGTTIREEDVPRIRLLEQSARANAGAIAPEGTIVIPLAMIVVTRSDGTGGLPEARVNQALADANFLWESRGFRFVRFGPIRYLPSDEWFDIDQNGEDTRLRQSPYMVNGMLPVFFVNSAPYCGISSFVGDGVDGIIMNNQCSGLPDNPTSFPHELGHWLNLFHTHETGLGRECVLRINCTTHGDLLCDTPADPNLNGLVNPSCGYVGGVTPFCTAFGDPPEYSPDTRNLMSYSRKECRTNITPQQTERARYWTINWRRSTNPNPAEPGEQFNPLYARQCLADWNNDGTIDFNDLLEYLNDFARANQCCYNWFADLNGDYTADFNDLLEYLNLYSRPCP
jgi:hypothetical protein